MNHSNVNRFAIIWLALVITLAFWLASCRTVKTDMHKTSRQVDSATVHHASAGQVTRADSAAFTQAATSQTTERATTAGQQLQVTFQDSGGTGPIVLEPRPDGSFMLQPGGRRVTGINYTGTQGHSRRDSTGTTTAGAARKNTVDSNYHNQSDSTHKKAKETTKTKNKRSNSAPWWLWPAVIVGAIVACWWLSGTRLFSILTRNPK